MRLHRALGLAALAVLVITAPAAAFDVIVGFESEDARTSLVKAWRARIVASVPQLELHLLRIENRRISKPEDLEQESGVLLVEENVRCKSPEGLQSAIWFLENRVDTNWERLLRRRDSPGRAEDEAGVVVAWLDGAVDALHPDLASCWDGGLDFVEEDGDPTLPLEILGSPESAALPGNHHATAVAGLLAEAGPGIRLRLYRVLDEHGRGSAFHVVRGIVGAVEDGARVLLLPLGGKVHSAAVGLALRYAAQRDVVVVAASGNDGDTSVDYPATDPDTLAVAAVDDEGRAAPFTCYGNRVDLSDRGVLLEVAYPAFGSALASGTSFAAARTAAAAAVLRREFPALGAEDVLLLLLETAGPLSEEEERLSRMLGAGLTDLEAALQAAAAVP